MNGGMTNGRRFIRRARLDVLLWLVLLALVGGSLFAAYQAPRDWVLLIDVAIAILQIATLLTFFMQLREARALILLTFVFAALFVAVMFALTFDDLFTRV